MTRQSRLHIFYSAFVVAGLALFLFLLEQGSVYFPRSNFSLPVKEAGQTLLPRPLLAIALILLVTKLAAHLMKIFRQPPVLGEVLGGIALGPTIFGKFFPEVQSTIFPKLLNPSIDALAQVGIILFMFVIGIEFDTRKLKNKVASSLVIAHASVFVPLLSGAATSFYLYPRYAPPGLPFSVFALFIGVSISVTAFPVLARIIKDLVSRTHPWR